ncbi:glutamate-cysteine ligase family protein [Streptomyces sp. H51]|uniref:glutamate-cysteine ligase family protein n=1 Tax=Streptomyces sp. H51 TaxID=3111770 RepID=UPI002D79FB28|nr:glutamate-cysteine ligase family protein [Streptomyces sp. H51]
MSESEAARLIFDHSLSRSRVGRTGVELEWLVLPVDDPTRRATHEELAFLARSFAGPLPGGSLVSWEPGGQVELSSAPHDSLRDCVEAVAGDLAVLRGRTSAAGMRLLGAGLDARPPLFTVALPRYQALRRHYAHFGNGDSLLCNTASVQVNVEAGDGSDGWRGRSRRWSIANCLGPVLMAMFANSPVARLPGRPEGPVLSGRQLLRLQVDPFRSGPLPCGGDPRGTWTRYALNTSVTAIRSAPDAGSRPAPGSPFRCPAPAGSGGVEQAEVWGPAPAGLSLRRWLRGSGPQPVHRDDVFHHLKSLVAPVRACGHLELRMIDAQGADDWVVPVAVVAALMDDAATSDAAASLIASASLAPTRQDWLDAALRGMTDPVVAGLARTVMELALSGLRRLGASAAVTGTVERFADNHTFRGLAPAHLRWPHRTAVA